jgi:hypothetical protein
MHLIGHGLSAIPFALTGHWWMALGAIAPDITWLRNEWQFRRSGTKEWGAWIVTLPESRITAYRIAHGVPFIVAAAVTTYLVAPAAVTFWLGWALHVALDLPTHEGRMRQQPLFPFSHWRWPWTIL